MMPKSSANCRNGTYSSPNLGPVCVKHDQISQANSKNHTGQNGHPWGRYI